MRWRLSHSVLVCVLACVGFILWLFWLFDYAKGQQLAYSNDEIGLMQIGGVDVRQGDGIGGREMDHGIPRDDIIAELELPTAIPTLSPAQTTK